MTDSIKGVDVEPVTAWFEAQRRRAPRGPLTFDLIAGGHSNLTFGVTDAAGHHYVLRRPPLGHVLATAHDMGREHKIISALGPTDVPWPRRSASAPTTTVNGAPFYVMDFVDGLVAPRRRGRRARHRRRRARNAGALARRHAGQDPRRRPRRRRPRRPRQEGGLHRPPAQALVRPVGEVEDPRAARSSTRSTTRSSPRVPEQGPAAIVHGDYRLDNCMIDDDGEHHRGARLGDLHARRPARRRRAADGLLDRARRRDADAAHRRRPPSRASSPARRCSTATPRPAAATSSQIDYYIAFGYWKLACIVEGVYARYVGGAMGSTDPAAFEGFEIQVERCAEAAAEAMGRLG